MAIPDYQSIMLPLLKLASDKKEHPIKEAHETLAKEFKLTDDELLELLPSGKQTVFRNRVGWARTYLKKAGLIEYTSRGVFKITDTGLKVLKSNPDKIDLKLLETFDEFVKFKDKKNNKEDKNNIAENETPITTDTPEEALQKAYQKLHDELSEQILQTIKQCSPDFFEILVIDLLVSMGYGGSRKEAGQAIGRTNDEGIDGIIKEDRLGLDIIYIQAKRWEGSVSRPEIQKFAGALQGKRAKKGIFLTTSNFTKGAIEFTNQIDSKIILIDGLKLAQLMIEHKVGVTKIETYEINRLDTDYFIEV